MRAWIHFHNGAASLDDPFGGLLVPPSGGVYLGGADAVSASDLDTTLIKYAP